MTYSKNLLQFSVVLAADVNNPSVLNPDFLRHNAIVDQSWGVNPSSALTTPAFSRVDFTNGFSIQIDPSRVVFTTENADGAEELCGIVGRYINQLPHVNYLAIGINPTFLVPFEDTSKDVIGMTLKNDGEWMAFEGIKPELKLDFAYALEQKIVTFSVKRHDAPSIPSGMIFVANVHRDVAMESAKIRKISSILEEWGKDLSDVSALIDQFCMER